MVFNAFLRWNRNRSGVLEYAEPLTHYVSPPFDLEPGSREAASFAIRTCFLHWGVLPWSCFGVVGLALGYFQYHWKYSALVSCTLYPLFGNAISKSIGGKCVDIFAVLVSVAGVATSLGLGCLQINGGLEYLFGMPSNEMTWFIIIALITLVFILSAVSGIKKGVQALSLANSYLALILLRAFSSSQKGEKPGKAICLLCVLPLGGEHRRLLNGYRICI